MSRPAARAAAVAAVALAVAGCTVPLVGGGGKDDVDADEAETALLDQRDAVAATAASLVEATLAALGGTVLETQGGWEGCTSRFPEGYADFQYAAVVRLRAAPGTPEVITDRLERAAEDSGLRVEGVDEDAVRVSDGDVSATLADIPDRGTEGDVLIQLAAEPCVAVPEEEWQDWLRREDPGPPVE